MLIKFTAIIATFNSEITIERCLKSILAQDYKLFEIIIVDNLSSDETILKIKNFNDERIIYISEKDMGIYDAWNKALRISTGSIIHFIGSDDFMSNNSVYSNILNRIDYLYIPDAICTSINIYNKETQIISTLPAKQGKKNNQLMNPFMGIFFNRKVFTMLGGFDSHYKISGDYEFMLRYGRLFTEKIEKQIISINMVIGGVSSNFNTCHILAIEILKSSYDNRYYKNVNMIILILIKTHIYKILYEIFGCKNTANLIDFIRLIIGKDKYWTK